MRSAVIVCAAAAALCGRAHASKLFPPDSQPFGEPYAVWAERWWKWATALTALAARSFGHQQLLRASPRQMPQTLLFTALPSVTSLNGQKMQALPPFQHAVIVLPSEPHRQLQPPPPGSPAECGIAQQDDNAWFIFGGFRGVGETIECNVPWDRGLVVSVLPGGAITYRPEGDFDPNNLKKQARHSVSDISAIQFKLDGQTLIDTSNMDSFLIKHTDIFRVYAVNDSLASMSGSTGDDEPAWLSASGWFAVLKPLSPGDHTIHARAWVGSEQVTDVKYLLRVIDDTTFSPVAVEAGVNGGGSDSGSGGGVYEVPAFPSHVRRE